jgi:hypothetical protein
MAKWLRTHGIPCIKRGSAARPRSGVEQKEAVKQRNWSVFTPLRRAYG